MDLSSALSPISSDTPVDIVDRGALYRDFISTYYRDQLDEISREYPHNKTLTVKYSDIIAFNKLRRVIEPEILSKPTKILSELEDAARDTLTRGGIPPDIIIHLIDISPKTRIRDIREGHLGHLVSLEGIVRKASEVRPRISLAKYRCTHGHNMPVVQRYGTLKPPETCPIDGCNSRRFELLEDRSEYIDSQRVRLQESPEGLRGGQQPQDIEVDILRDLCARVSPGDRVTINGIVKTHPRRVSGGDSSTFEIHIEAVSIEISESEYTQIEISDEETEEIQKLSRDPMIHDMIAASLAPSIYGQTDLKSALSHELFGGTARTAADGSNIRGDIHILIVGDPGIAKSQIMQYVSRIAPRAIFTSGQSSTKAGLTAAAVRDESDGRWTLEAGALVLADMGIAIVDELDKMTKPDRDALHEAMEQQSVSLSKAGITATLHSRCALLAAANPKYGRFDPTLSLGEQVDLPPSLLSRFDLIFVLTDQPNTETDEAIARHIIHNRTGERPETIRHIDPGLLKKYVSIAKQIKPTISPEAADLIVAYYVSVRGKAKNQAGAVPITARQNEGVIRLAEASARMRLSETVSADDARRAIQMVDSCLRKIAYNADTQTWDIDSIATGKPKASRDMERVILDIYRSLESQKPTREDVVTAVIEATKWDTGTVTQRLELMIRSGTFYEPDGTYIREA